MISVKHRTASGQLGEAWEFDSVRRAILLVYRGADATIRVATHAHPKHGCFSISRVAETIWVVRPFWFSHESGVFVVRRSAFDFGGRLNETLALTHAPDAILEEMSEL